MQKLKQKHFNLIILIILLIAGSTFSLFNINRTVSADTSVEIVVADEHLSSALLDIYNNLPGSGGDETVLHSRMFQGTGIVNLNLSGCFIESLDGFNKLYFDNTLTSINLSNNALATTNRTHFSSVCAKISSLDLSNNKLTSVKLTDFTKLSTLNLNNNELDSVDISNVYSTDYPCVINLSSNNFSSIANVTLPSVANLTQNVNVQLFNNNIVNATSIVDGFLKLELGVQGIVLKENEKINTTSLVKYYKINAENVTIEFKNSSNNQTKIIQNNSCENIVDLISFLGVGTFTMTYKMNNLPMYDSSDSQTIQYQGKTFSILPSPPTCKIVVNEQEMELMEAGTLTQTATLNFYTTEDDAVIYFTSNINGDWTNGNSFEITKGGDQIIYLKVAKNGLESEVVTYLIKARANLFLPDIVLLIIIIVAALLIFLGGIPLIKKYLIK